MRLALLLATCLLHRATPARGGDAIEAVAGTITAPMQKKTVLESPGPTNQENHGTKGGATFGFSCPSAAKVEVYAVALVLGTMQDSHFVSVDGNVKVIWEMLVNNKVMHDWGNTAKTPSFDVSAGDHMFEIAEKEDGARFYELHISGGCTWLASRAASVPAVDFTSVLAPWRVLPLVEFKGATDSFDTCPPGDTACSGELTIPFTCTGASTATFTLNSLRWNVALYASIAVDGAGWVSWDLHDSIFWDLSAASPSFSVTAGSHTVSLGGDSPGVKLIQVVITSGSCEFAEPPTDVPATSVPMTDPPTPAPPTDIPETSVPDTDAPPTNVPKTSIPETDAPPTDAPPTDVPTPAPPTDIPDTDAPPTDAPPTDVPTPAPPTDVPETDVPKTDAPPTNVPDTDVPPTDAPDTDVPKTDAPPTDVPETDVPMTDVPKTDVPMTDVPPTDVPDTDVPETAVPDTDTPPTDVPKTSIPDTAVPDTNVPPTAVPETSVPATSQPTDAPTTAPVTATDAPATGTTPVPGTPGQPCSGLGLTACQAAAQCAWGGAGCGLATACTGLAEAACGGQQACVWKGGATGCVALGGECLGLARGDCRALPQACVWAADRTCQASPCAGAASATCATVPGCVLPPGGACASECAGQTVQAVCAALPACVWTDRGACAPTECALATTDQACGSFAACAWKNGQCAATACTGLASDACDAAPGCVVRGGSCAVTACGGVAPQAACEAKAGCEWAAGAVCAATECALLPAGPCRALASCAWSAAGACDTSPCRGADTSAVCETRAGCVWANDECAASATPAPGAACAGSAQAACDADAACVWTGGACTAAGSECVGLPEVGCAAAPACAWVGGACAAVPCTGVGRAVCDAAAACVWGAATGRCGTECAAAATQGACGALASCAWAGAGACQATACTGAGQAECAARGACAWNGAQCAVLSCDGRTQVECTALGAACQWDGAGCAAAEVVYTLQPSGPGEVLTPGGSQGGQTLAPTNVGGAAKGESLYAGGGSWLGVLSKVAAASHFVPYNVAGPLLAGQAQLLALECWVDDDLPFFVHPTRFDIGDTKHSPYLSCLAGNLILLLCAAVLHFIAAVVMKQVKGDAKKGQGAVMFPGLLMFFYMALVPGSVLAGAHLMFNGTWWPAGLIAELFVIGVGAAIFFRLRDIPARAAFCEDSQQRHPVSRFFLGPGEWRSIQPHAVATYGPVFMWYNDRYPRFFAAELLFTFIVCFAQGVRSHSDADQCSSKLVAQGISFIVFALLVVALRPFARPFCNWFIVASFTFISAGLITTGIQLKASGRATAIREVLLSIGLIILLVQGLISLAVLVYVKMTRRAAHCPLLNGNNNTTRGAEKYREELAESILNTPATTSTGTPGDQGLDASGCLLDSSGDQVSGSGRSRRGSNYSHNSFTALPQPPPARQRGGTMAVKGFTGVAPSGGAGRGSAKGSPMLENPLSGFGQSPSPPKIPADTGAMSGSGGSGAADLASWVRRARGRSSFGGGAGGAMTLPPAPRRGSGIVSASRESSHSRIGV